MHMVLRCCVKLTRRTAQPCYVCGFHDTKCYNTIADHDMLCWGWKGYDNADGMRVNILLHKQQAYFQQRILDYDKRYRIAEQQVAYAPQGARWQRLKDQVVAIDLQYHSPYSHIHVC